MMIRELCNRFLTAKRHQLDIREIAKRTLADCYQTCEKIAAAFGKILLVSDLASDDFERLRADLAKTRGPVALGDEIGRIRSAFKYVYGAGWIDKPMRYGPTFKKPSKKVLREARHIDGA